MNKSMLLVGVVLVLAGFGMTIAAEEQFATWADYHPEMAKIFAKPPTSWECETVHTEFSGVQPTVVLGLKAELIANASGTLVHSTDGGHTWRVLCDIPGGHSDGCGVTEQGTILASYATSQGAGQQRKATYVLRSSDRGQTWDEPIRLDPRPHDKPTVFATRMTRLPGGVMALPVMLRPAGKEVIENFLYLSSDDGRTWKKAGSMGWFNGESDLLALPSGRLLAATRFQKKKQSSDPPDLASPYFFDPEHKRAKPNCGECALGATANGGHSVYKQTALLFSDDGGQSWSTPRLITGWLQQTGCLMGLSDGTLVMPFSHKDKGQGQRFLVSYDEGKTWSRTVYELHVGGMYASSVALADDTIVTVYAEKDKLGVLRWRVPPRETVAEGGFFEPRPVARSIPGPSAK